MVAAAINSWWAGNLRAKQAIGSVGFYGHNALMSVPYLRDCFGMQPDLVSEDLITAILLRLAGAEVVYRDYLQLGEGIETTHFQYVTPTQKWSAGAIELMRSKMFRRYLYAPNIPISEKIDTLFGLAHYWIINRYMLPANVLFVLGTIVFGIAAYSVLPWQFAVFSIFFSIMVNIFMLVDLSHTKGGLTSLPILRTAIGLIGAGWSWLKFIFLGNPNWSIFSHSERKNFVILGGFLYWVTLHVTQSRGVDLGKREKAE
ncbi:MAG TPA: glycosyltransferase family 2 protein, partial [Bacillota bacterium]|nr:glycosyltransferase family 2 protein [Bacillota bacterium]